VNVADPSEIDARAGHGGVATSRATAHDGPVTQGRTFAVEDLGKRYGGVVALRSATCAFRAGEIVGLVGKNGAGKSTLIKILGGATHADRGRVLVDGQAVRMRSPHDALNRGIAVVHQELAIIPGLSVGENVWLGLGYPKAAGPLVARSALRARTEQILERIGLVVPVDVATGTLGIAEQRLVMIARGLAARARLLVLDEPSASFTDEEISTLHQVVRDLAADGVGTVYVSHRVSEVLALTDRVVVMRDGAVVDDQVTATLDRTTLVALISGGDDQQDDEVVVPAPSPRRSRPAAPAGTGTAASSENSTADWAARREVLRVEHLGGGRGGRVVDASLAVHAGEVLGIAGLVGSGRTELVRMVFGCEQPRHGSIWLHGRPVRIGSPRAAVRHGIALVPEDRRNEGVLLSFSVAYNMTLPSLARYRRWRRWGWPNRRRERQAASTMMHELGVVASGPDAPVETLSGGNQQKVVVGKWLLRDADVFVFDEPSVGIDVHAKAEMFRRIALLAAQGKAVLVISSEFEELEEHCHRVVVMREGRTVGELTGADVSEANMLALCYGDEGPTRRRAG
jgi:ribose transport system ATP-binding protein